MTVRPCFVALTPLVALLACQEPPPVAPPPATPAAAPAAVTAGSASATPAVSPAPAGGAPAHWTAHDVPLPGATAPAALDYIAYEPPSPAASGGRVWVPAGGTGSVAVFDVASGAMRRVDGFKTAEREAHGAKRVVGPSSVAIGAGFAYVGNRASAEVCAVDLRTLTLGACTPVGKPIDGVAYVESSKEVWVTTPGDETLTVLDASTAGRTKVVASVKVEGSPEGYATDEGRGLFFTNLEDKGKSVVIDVKRRAVVATWTLGCNADGPRGLAIDPARNLAFVACTDHIELRDASHDGALLGTLDTGAGVDNVDYVAATHRLYVAAGKAARLTVAELTPAGQLVVVATADTHAGARNGVADARGAAYVADGPGARLVVASPAP